MSLRFDRTGFGMELPYHEIPADSSRPMMTRLGSDLASIPDANLQDVDEPAPGSTYAGKGEVKAAERSMHRSTRSAFICLPAELRNRIYELVLRQIGVIRIDDTHDMIYQPANMLAITHVCRQLRHESRLMLCLVNTFLVDFNFVFWLRILDDDQREAITSIELLWTLPVSLRNGVWSAAPVKQHGSYVGVVLRVLPGLRHVSLAITLAVGSSAGISVPGEDNVQRCLGPFQRSFEKSTTGVWVARVASCITYAQALRLYTWCVIAYQVHAVLSRLSGIGGALARPHDRTRVQFNFLQVSGVANESKIRHECLTKVRVLRPS